MTIWQELIAGLGGFTVVVAVLGWLGKTVITHWMDKAVSVHRQKLEQDTESFKLILTKQGFEHQTRFLNIYNKQAEVIATIYSKLVATTGNALSYADCRPFASRPKDPNVDDWLLRVADAISDLNSYFQPNRLYLPDDIAVKVSELMDCLSEGISTAGTEGHSQDISGVAINMQEYGKFRDELRKKSEELVALLHDKFQQLIGMKPEPL